MRSRWTKGWVATVVLALAGCSTPAPPPEGVTLLSIPDAREYWAKQGFVELVPPVHLPSSSAAKDQVEIWARVPEGGEISGPAEVVFGQTPPALLFPPGSVLDRVEYADMNGKRFVVDVRGTRIDDEGKQWFHVYRRGAEGLFGFEWARSDEGAHGRATAALVAKLAKEAPAKRMAEAQRAKFLGSVEGKNACAACHVLSRDSNLRQGEHGIVNRGTDASGFFTPWTLLAPEIPLERYGGHDASESDRHTTIRCPPGVKPTAAEDGRKRCASSEVPMATYDLRQALADEEARALRVCTGRRYLMGHMSSTLRGALAAVASDCPDSR